MASTKYQRYLATDCWYLQLRRAVFERANGKCELRLRCHGARPSEVHHENYESVGRETLTDLRAACFACHRAVHGLEPKRPANDNVANQLDLFAKKKAG
jgi:5-methylcytosine-specific restriction endonuclease McrA